MGYLGTLPASRKIPLGMLFQHRDAEVPYFEIRPGCVVTIFGLEEDVVGLDVTVADRLGAAVVDDVQGTSDLDETVPDEVLRERSKRTDRTLQISAWAVLEPQDQVLIVNTVSFEFMVYHSDDVSAAWEDLLEDEWLQRHVVAVQYVVGVRLLANGEFTGPLVFDEGGAALASFSDGPDYSPFCAGKFSRSHTGNIFCR